MSENINTINEKSFEENMERLKEIVSKLEGGKETLKIPLNFSKKAKNL